MGQHTIVVMQADLDPNTGNFPDGSYISPRLAPTGYRHFFKIFAFKTASKDNSMTPVQLTGGNLTICASDGQNFGDICNGSITFDPKNAYARPSIMGTVENIKLDVNGLTYVDSTTKKDMHDITFRVEIHSYN